MSARTTRSGTLAAATALEARNQQLEVMLASANATNIALLTQYAQEQQRASALESKVQEFAREKDGMSQAMGRLVANGMRMTDRQHQMESDLMEMSSERDRAMAGLRSEVDSVVAAHTSLKEQVGKLQQEKEALEAELVRRRIADTIVAHPMSDDDCSSATSASSCNARSPRRRHPN